MDSLTYESTLCVIFVCTCLTGCLLLAFCTKAHDVCVESIPGMTLFVCVFVSSTAEGFSYNFTQLCLHYISLRDSRIETGETSKQKETKVNV